MNYFKGLLFMIFLLSVSKAETEVSCVLSESCMLPCQFPFGSEPLIHWIRVSAGDSMVHSYYRAQDQLGYQVVNFKNRTSLFQDQISRGNASLLLRGVKVQDEGKYKCYISTIRGLEESFVNVKTEAPVSKVRINQEKNRIICSSEGIYPKPELTWSTDPPSNAALDITTSVQQTEEQLYNISSSLKVSDDDPYLNYSCTVSTQRSMKTAAISKEELLYHGSDSSGKVIGGLIATIVVAGLIGGGVTFCVLRRNEKFKRVGLKDQTWNQEKF